MTVIKCAMTDCKYNNSCCSSPHSSKETICTKDKVNLIIEEEIQQFECKDFEEKLDKPVECPKCQMLKYGGIKMNKDPIKFD